MSRSTALEAAFAKGRARREALPRTSLAHLAPRPNDYDPVERLLWQGRTRIEELLPLRYGRMLASALAFYRGSALLMADDLVRGSSTALELQISGDAHLSNFNLFSSPERRLMFDLDDFDETDVGPFEWDVKRLVTSLVLASAHLGHNRAHQERVATLAAREYRVSMRRLATETRLNVWYSSLDVHAVASNLEGYFTDNALRRVDRVVRLAQRSTRHDLAKVIEYRDSAPRIISSPPLLVPLAELGDGPYLERGQIEQIMREYRATLSSDRQVLLGQFRVVDAARKVVGVGSVGTECYAILLVGRDERDPFLLQVKQATDSVVATALGRDAHLAGGERVVAGQRLMQAASDVFLGWYSLEGAGVPRSFYVRQLYDDKGAIDIERLDEKLLVTYGRLCAWVLARAHARSGRSAEIAGYLGTGDVADEALASFAAVYVERTREDVAALARARDEGRITATT